MFSNFIELAGQYLTPEITTNISKFVGESPGNTQKALGLAVPSLMGAACNHVSKSEGAGSLLDWVSPAKLDYSTVLSNFGNPLRGGMPLEDVLKKGEGLISPLLGSRAPAVADVIAKASGISAVSASSILKMAAPLVLGLIGKQAATHGLKPAGLTDFFASQRENVLRTAPAGLATALGVGSMDNVCGAPTPLAHPLVASQVEERKASPWLWLIPISALIALALVLWHPWRKATMAGLHLPCGTTLSVEEGGFNYNLATFLMKASTAADLPHRFVFDHLNFESATTQLTPESNSTVDNLSAILKCFPSTLVTLDGHTDNTGDPDSNKLLSVNRANAVKDLLIRDGVPPDRIATDGYGEEKPIASNDTDAGRARNRRTELQVTRIK